MYVSCMVNEPVAPAGWLNATTLTVRRYLDTSETEKAVEVEGLLPGIFSLAQSINIYIISECILVLGKCTYLLSLQI